jgi:hypothetical protein
MQFQVYFKFISFHLVLQLSITSQVSRLVLVSLSVDTYLSYAKGLELEKDLLEGLLALSFVFVIYTYSKSIDHCLKKCKLIIFKDAVLFGSILE